MRRVRAGEVFVVEGLWMMPEEAALVKQELLARGTKTAKRLADAIGFPQEEWKAGGALLQARRRGSAGSRDKNRPPLEG